MITKYKNEIIVAIFIILLTMTFFYLYGIVLPFIIGLLLAFKCQPVITFIQKFVRNKNLATSLFLIGITSFLLLIFLFFAVYINKDFNRLQNSFHILKTQNKDKLDYAGQKIKNYLEKFYDVDEVKTKLKIKADSLKTSLTSSGETGIDTKAIEDAFNKIASVFTDNSKNEPDEKSKFTISFIALTSIAYFLLILFNIEYFDAWRKRYFGGKVDSKFQLIINDFNQSFIKYFSLRTKIVLLLSIIYLTAFIILNLPGFILFTILIVLLSYIPYFQYIALIPISISCLALSTEGAHGFLFYYAIVTGVFVFASLVEETVLNPFIMEKNIGMNPVIMVLAISVWSYLLGIQGILIGIPLTSLIIIYVKRYFLESYLKLNE
ncbi:MAG: AI-2E family transporter [Bacteroidota bacterium]